MKTYERVRKIFNSCDNSRMRDVDIQEIETSDIADDVRQFCAGKNVNVEKRAADGGATVYSISADGLVQRVTYTEL